MYIVTGGAGFIGSAMVWALNQQGITDILVVDNLAQTEKWRNLVGLAYQAYEHRDAFLERVRARSIAERIDGVIHMGACSSTTETDADFLMRNNVDYSKNSAVLPSNGAGGSCMQVQPRPMAMARAVLLTRTPCLIRCGR